MLFHCVRRFEERAEELAEILRIEAGKPIQDSRGEVTRLIDTFRIAAREAQNPNGEVLNLEIGERTRGYRGFTKRVPVGPCAFITPFNFPLNLVGREGVRYAIEDMTEIRSLVIRETGDSKSVDSR